MYILYFTDIQISTENNIYYIKTLSAFYWLNFFQGEVFMVKGMKLNGNTT